MPDLSVTSGTGLKKLMVKMPMPDKLFSGIPALTYDFSASYSTNNTSSSHFGSQCGRAAYAFLSMPECRTVWHLIGTGMNKNTDVGTSPVPSNRIQSGTGSSSTRLRYRMPECQCWRHRPRYRCPAILDTDI
jgi:hypothetical protein